MLEGVSGVPSSVIGKSFPSRTDYCSFVSFAIFFVFAYKLLLENSMALMIKLDINIRMYSL